MVITHAAHGTWSPWLMPGDVILSGRPPGRMGRAFVVAVHKNDQIAWVVQAHTRRLERYTLSFIDRQMQLGNLALWRHDVTTTHGLNGWSFSAGLRACT